MCGTGAHTRLHQEETRQCRKASAGGETNREEKRGEMEKKRRRHTNTEKAEFDTIVCWRETKTPKPQARLFNLHPVTASRFAFNAKHDRRGMVVGKERVSGKSGNAQSDVRAMQSKNERREIKQKSQISAGARVIVRHRSTNTVAKFEREAS